MKAQFFDRQDRTSPHNGMVIADSPKIASLIEDMRNRPPFFCELVGEYGFNLLLGISDTLGCAQYSANDGSPPYLMATCREMETNEEFMDFLTGNTDTPVPMKFCLSIETIKRIASDFIESGERSSRVSWEEI